MMNIRVCDQPCLTSRPLLLDMYIYHGYQESSPSRAIAAEDTCFIGNSARPAPKALGSPDAQDYF